VTRASYPPSTSQASGVDQIAEWIGQHPERTGVYAFIAARLMERDRLCYRTVFDHIVRAAVDSGRSEAAARKQVYQGFAACAAGHIEPPLELEDADG
jgi:hypothetical protein